MPNYDYVCDSCNYTEEKLQPMSDEPLELACPVCGGPLRRKIGKGAVLDFKGSGFHCNDYP